MNHNVMEHIETASVDELRSVQLQRLKATLKHAYENSPVYKKKFDQMGVHPEGHAESGCRLTPRVRPASA